MPTRSRTHPTNASITTKVVCPRFRTRQTTRKPSTSTFAPPKPPMCPSTAEPRERRGCGSVRGKAYGEVPRRFTRRSLPTASSMVGHVSVRDPPPESSAPPARSRTAPGVAVITNLTPCREPRQLHTWDRPNAGVRDAVRSVRVCTPVHTAGRPVEFAAPRSSSSSTDSPSTVAVDDRPPCRLLPRPERRWAHGEDGPAARHLHRGRAGRCRDGHRQRQHRLRAR